MIRNRDNFYKKHKGCLGFKLHLVFALLFLLGATLPSFAQADSEYEELSLSLNVQRIGNIELPALIRNETVYLPIKELFDFLKIKNLPNSNLDTISGFYIQPQATYLVDKVNSNINYAGKSFSIPATDLILTETNLYLKSDWYKTIFDLDAVFNFRSLSITVSSKIDLPAIREMRQEVMRKNIVKLKGDHKADTIIGREYPAFHAGMADWSFTANKDVTGKVSTRLNLYLGTNIAGGEGDVFLNMNSKNSSNRDVHFFRWRYVNNKNYFLKQVNIGRISTPLISSTFGPITGIQFTNTPTTYKRSFGTYTLSNTTEPGWMVELYVNNVLVNYMQADASGFFSFEVPMVYGNSTVKLKFFGPWGEERTREQIVTVPFNFLPGGQWEYNVSAGFINGQQRQKFTRAITNYGLNNMMTLSAGVEYLASNTKTNSIPFFSASARLTSNMMLSAEYNIGVSNKAAFTYRLPANLQFDAEYIKYADGQTSINNNYLSEKKAVVSMPIRSKRFNSFNRLTISQVTVPKTNFTTAEMLMSAVIKGVSTNFTTNAYINDPRNPYVYSTLSLGYRTKKGIRVTPLLQYDYRLGSVSQMKFEIEKTLSNKGYVHAAYERNTASGTGFFTLGMRYSFAFAQVSLTARQVGDKMTLINTAHGSVMFDDKTKFKALTNIDNVGRGAIIIVPFLDVNCNGIRDNGEKNVSGLNMQVPGGRMRYLKDSSICITGLEAYTNCFIEFDKNSFENLSWRLGKKSMSVAINPNMFKRIEVPIKVMGEVAGNVYLQNEKGKNGQSRIIVGIFSEDGKPVSRVLTEIDGYFSYLGLPPGKYYTRVDEQQLAKLKMKSTGDVSFTVKQNVEGDYIDGIDFTLKVMEVK